MPPKLKLSRQCDRCPREEHISITLEEAVALGAKKDPPPALRIFLDGEEVATHGVLCAACREIVRGYLSGAVRQQDKRAARRKKKQKAELTRKKA